jgi:adenylate kinase family enzyme
MKRISVIGNAGGGKSTLCRELSKALDIPLFEFDKIQWKPGWIRAAKDEIKMQHDEILAQDRWIIDGWGDFDLIEDRFRLADTIILIDFPLYIHYWWASKRQFACIFKPRVDGPEGCPMLPMTWPLLKMIWDIHFKLRPQLLDLVNAYRSDKRIVHITTIREFRSFTSAHDKAERQEFSS